MCSGRASPSASQRSSPPPGVAASPSDTIRRCGRAPLQSRASPRGEKVVAGSPSVGSQRTYALLGYLRLDRNIFPAIEDLQDREELRVAGRVEFKRFWSAFASAVLDLTNRREDPLSLADGFDPVRHRVGVQYEDDCLRAGITWRRDYQDTGDARRGNSFLLSLAFTNLGR